MTDPGKLRNHIRGQRRKLDDATRIVFSNDICAEIQKASVWKNARKVAVFRSFDGEVNINRLVEQALDERKQVFLPVIVAAGQPMKFAWYDRQSAMIANRFGIPEPDVPQSSLLDPRGLDLVIAPLVAFDANCQRIGMGGGFYDRTFAFRKTAGSPKPWLVGVAFELQKVDHVEAQSWDVPLDAVVTETNMYGTLE